MRSPLLKRIPREMKHDWGKYLVIFLFMILTIGFISGFLVADNSIKKTYDESFEKYNIEDGNFEVGMPLNDELKSKLEDLDLRIYENTYTHEDVKSDGTLRIFQTREEVNKASLLEGALPKGEDEISLDRLYAENNGFKVGDKLTAAGKQWKVSGLVALSDYSAIFKKNTDFMFDANKFGVAIVDEEAFDAFDENDLHYNYSWKYNDEGMNQKEKEDKEDEIKEVLTQNTILMDFITEEDNQSIHFAGEDMGSDKAMFTWLLYIVIVIMAFVFAITINTTIETESSVIGTLRASGYSKGELLRHYLALPLMVTIISAIIGNILGYTYFKGFVVNMYYGAYSLPTYETVWNGNAFFMTTVIPCIIMILINFAALVSKLSLSPLRFLRKDLKRRQKHKTMRLPGFKFFTRFRLRIIFQNIPNYSMLLVGILFANVLMLFGTMFTPLLNNYRADVEDSMICRHQYILKLPVETTVDGAEKYGAQTLDIYFDDKDLEEEVSVLGVERDSQYIKDVELPEGNGEVVVSSGLMQKYGLAEGDTVKFKADDSKKKYSFEVAGSYHYPATMSIFMSREAFNKVFNKEEGSFNGYFSDKKLTDIDKVYIASEITEADMTNMVDQLDLSMGKVFPLFTAFAVILSVMLIYLISKIIIDKNRNAISITKILGYGNGEIARLYIVATAFMFLFSELVTLLLSYWIIKAIYFVMMQDMTGWLTFYIDPRSFVYTFLLGMLSYAIVTIFQFMKIKRIPKEEALKDMGV